MNLLPLDLPAHADKLQLRAPALLLEVQSLDVTDATSYVAVCQYEITAKEFLKRVKAVTDDIKTKHKAALESALEPWNKITAPFEEAADLATEKRKTYRREQDRMAAVDAAKRLIEATERAQAERAENIAALEGAHAATGDPQFVEAAERLKATRVEAAVVPATPAVPKVKGIRDTKVITITVTDKVALVRAIGAALILAVEPDADIVRFFVGDMTASDVDALAVDESWLKTCYRQRKEAFSFPGVSATYE